MSIERLQHLRSLMAEHQIEALLVPQTDEFQGEHIAPYAQRLRWLTGFTGSAGLGVITRDQAALFVDGRYTLQAKLEVDLSAFRVFDLSEKRPSVWLEEQVEGARIGFDPWLHTVSDREHYSALNLYEVPQFIDQIWLDQPSRPSRQFQLYPLCYAGRDHRQKLTDIRRYMTDRQVDALIVCDTSSIAWLLNVRGTDIPHTPITLAYAVIYKDRVLVYANAQQPSNVLESWGVDVQVRPFEKFEEDLSQLKELNIAFDPHITPYKVLKILQDDNHIMRQPDPCLKGRAVKNQIEVEGMRQCHIRDGVALTKFMFWLEHNVCSDEYAAAQKLLSFRQQQALFQQTSFETIAAFAENGAIVHYRPNAQLTRSISEDGLLLLDSGGQYLDGTTDVTRVFVMGQPRPEYIEAYTLVLKGHIALACAKFPRGTTGMQLDVLARMPLWQAGKNYAHGTGHGIGSYLNVHEGPHSISPGERSRAPLEAGMIVSNEPGYYEEGAFGIRIESVLVVTEARELGPNYLEFETLTLVPLESRLIDQMMLNEEERRWVQSYQERVVQTLMPYMNGEEQQWLQRFVN